MFKSRIRIKDLRAVPKTYAKLGTSTKTRLIRMRLLYLLLMKGAIHPKLQEKMERYGLSDPMAYFRIKAKSAADEGGLGD